MLARQLFSLEPCKVSSRSPSVDVAAAVCETSSIRIGRKVNQQAVYRRAARKLTVIRQQAGPGRGHLPAAGLAGKLSLGIDCGTSGARSIVIDGMSQTLAALAALPLSVHLACSLLYASTSTCRLTTCTYFST